MDGSIALVEFSKHSRRACVKIFEYAHIEVGLKILICTQAHLKPWLVEVNASPSLSTTTHSDRVMKMALIRDVLDVVLPKDITNYRGAFTLGPCEDAGGFSVLYDEALEAQLKAEAEQAAPNRGAQRRGSQAGAKQAPSRFF